jgi:hypothetical protein
MNGELLLLTRFERPVEVQRSTIHQFKLNWTEIPERSATTLTMVERFHILEDGRSCENRGWNMSPREAFSRDRAPERFHCSVLVAIAYGLLLTIMPSRSKSDRVLSSVASSREGCSLRYPVLGLPGPVMFHCVQPGRVRLV